jgi:hypothetical protein
MVITARNVKPSGELESSLPHNLRCVLRAVARLLHAGEPDGDRYEAVLVGEA